MKENKRINKKWYKVDNLAIVYTSSKEKKSENIFRFAAIMKEKVNPDILHQAFETTMKRFPYFAVRLRRGIFWHYFETNNYPYPKIEYDDVEPTTPINTTESNKYHIRILYYNKKISLEIFHALCDGYGASFLLQTVLANYLRLMGHEISDGYGVLKMGEKPRSEEYEDSYIKYGKLGKKSSSRKYIGAKKVYKNFGTPIPRNRQVDVVTGVLPLDKCLGLARENNVTLTEYLTAVQLYNLYKKQKREEKKEYPIRATIPVNCRQYFKSETLRNFFLVINPTIYPNIIDYTFTDVLKEVKAGMNFFTNKASFMSEMVVNLKAEENPLARIIPLFLKKRVISTFYKYLGEKHNSVKISNVGNFKIPKEMEGHIERVDVVMGRPLSHSLQCGIMSFKNNLSVTFSSMIIEKDIERDFFKHFINKGIEVYVESNVN